MEYLILTNIFIVIVVFALCFAIQSIQDKRIREEYTHIIKLLKKITNIENTMDKNLEHALEFLGQLENFKEVTKQMEDEFFNILESYRSGNEQLIAELYDYFLFLSNIEKDPHLSIHASAIAERTDMMKNYIEEEIKILEERLTSEETKKNVS